MAHALVITEARVFDPATGAVREGETILVEDGIIRAIEPGKPRFEPQRVVKARGRTVMPGLIDAHVHLASFADTHDEEILGITPETIARSTLRGAAAGARLLSAGTTTVRDMGCKHAGIFALRDAFASDLLSGPRLFISGSGATMTGGVSHSGTATEADGPDAVRRVARTALKLGADFVKLFASPGILHPVASKLGVQYTAEELGAGIEEAHRVGKTAAVHATVGGAARLSVELGIDSIEHGHEISDELARQMAEREVFLVPTLWHYRRVALHGEKLGFRPPIIARAKEVCAGHAESFIRAWKAGVPIAAGTDSAGGPGHPAPDLPMELQYMAEVGMSPMDVLRSATSGAARCLRLDQKLGRLEAGFVADLVGWSSDPLTDLSTLQTPWLVVKSGEVVLHHED